MNWLNLPTNWLHAPEFVACRPVARGTWLAVMLWCALQENGGRIAGARAWKCRRWQQTCGVTAREVMAAAPLLVWEDDDLVVWNYPRDKEEQVQEVRAAASAAGRRRQLAKVTGADAAPDETTREERGETPAPARRPQPQWAMIPPPRALPAQQTHAAPRTIPSEQAVPWAEPRLAERVGADRARRREEPAVGRWAGGAAEVAQDHTTLQVMAEARAFSCPDTRKNAREVEAKLASGSDFVQKIFARDEAEMAARLWSDPAFEAPTPPGPGQRKGSETEDYHTAEASKPGEREREGEGEEAMDGGQRRETLEAAGRTRASELRSVADLRPSAIRAETGDGQRARALISRLLPPCPTMAMEGPWPGRRRGLEMPGRKSGDTGSFGKRLLAQHQPALTRHDENEGFAPRPPGRGTSALSGGEGRGPKTLASHPGHPGHSGHGHQGDHGHGGAKERGPAPTLEEALEYAASLQGNVPEEICRDWWHDHDQRARLPDGAFVDHRGRRVIYWMASMRHYSQQRRQVADWAREEQQQRAAANPTTPSQAQSSRTRGGRATSDETAADISAKAAPQEPGEQVSAATGPLPPTATDGTTPKADHASARAADTEQWAARLARLAPPAGTPRGPRRGAGSRGAVGRVNHRPGTTGTPGSSAQPPRPGTVDFSENF